MDLSIIIVSFNNKDYLQQAVNSIYENTDLGLSYEIIVVDNNSQDGTLKMLSEQFPRIKVIDNDKNLGFARANNLGLSIAAGRIILFLNNDTFVYAGVLNKMVSFIESDQNIGAITPKLIEEDGVTIQHQGRRNKKIWEREHPLKIKSASGAALMVKKSVLDKVGGFDENFFFYNEDLDLCKRIINHGFVLYYYPQAAIIHYGGKGSELISSKALTEGLRGGLYFAVKHYTLLFPLYYLVMLLYLLAAMGTAVIKLFFSSKTKRPISQIKAYLAVLKAMITFDFKGKVK